MPDQETLGAGQGAREVVGGLGRAAPDLVRDARVPDLRHDGGGQVLQPLQAVKRVLWLDRDGANGRVMLLQTSRRADERAGGAKSGDEVRDASGGLREDLHGRALVMRPHVGRIRVLIRIEVEVRLARHQVANRPDGAVRSLQRVAVHDFGTVSGDQRFALGAHVPRHHQLHPIALGRADHRVGDSGVARGRVDDRLVMGELPALLAVQDHRERRAIFHGAAGVEPLGLGVDLESRKVPLEQPDPQQRRVADQPDDARAHGSLCHLVTA